MAKRRDFARPVPGSSSFVWEAADADLVADVMVWSTHMPEESCRLLFGNAVFL
jgi:hypothetical protein